MVEMLLYNLKLYLESSQELNLVLPSDPDPFGETMALPKALVRPGNIRCAETLVVENWLNQ